PITIDQQFNAGLGGALEILFDKDPWASVISFQAGIPIVLGGTLDLEFDDGVDLTGEVGKTIHLFDWTGVSPSGTFASGGPYTWDVSALYSTGNVTLAAVPEPSAVVLAVVGIMGFAFLAAVNKRHQLRIALAKEFATP